MRKNLKILENRVAQASKRLSQLATERNHLLQEIETLRDQLDNVETSEPVRAGELPGIEVWQVERNDTITSLREALGELRGN